MICLCRQCHEPKIDCPCGSKIFESDRYCFSCGRPKWSMIDEQKRREADAKRTGGRVD